MKNEMQCAVCRTKPCDLDEYQEAVSDWNRNLEKGEKAIGFEAYVKQEEGTFNSDNNLFVCTSCYIKIGMPSNDANVSFDNNWVPSDFIVQAKR